MNFLSKKTAIDLIDDLSKKIKLDLFFLIKNGNWISIRFFTASLTGFLLSLFFVKFGTQELLGQYQLVLSILSIVSVVSFLGLNASALEAVVHGRFAGVLRVAKLNFLFSLLGIPILVAIGLFYIFLRNDHTLGETIIFSSLLFPFFYSLSGWNVYYEGRLLFKKPSLQIVCLNIVQAVAVMLGIIFKINVFGLVFIYLFVAIFFQSIFFWEIRKEISDHANNYVDLKFGMLVSLQKFFSGLASTFPPIVVSFFFGIEYVAIYFIAYYVIGTLSSFAGNFITLYMPILFKKIKLNHKSIILNNIVAGIVVWSIFIIFLKFFFVLIYGEGYLESLYLAYKLSFLLLLMPLHTYLVSFMSTRKKNGLLIIIFIFTNFAGLAVIFALKKFGFSWGIVGYLYVLEIFTILPCLASLYLSSKRQEAAN